MTHDPAQSITLTTDSPDATFAIGAGLGALLIPGDVVCLSGDLGAGKTAIARGIGAGWDACEPVNSPTFVFAHEHRRDRDSTRLVHIDCYRLTSVADAETIGIEDILAGDRVVIIEWPERIAPLIPPDHVWIELVRSDEVNHPDRREIGIIPHGTRAQLIVSAL